MLCLAAACRVDTMAVGWVKAELERKGRQGFAQAPEAQPHTSFLHRHLHVTITYTLMSMRPVFICVVCTGNSCSICSTC